MTKYLVYDVFTDKAFGGNQLAVFPDAQGIPENLLQKIAAEFNFSEVTFVYPPSDPNHTAQVRIFTPTMEMEFAGHPTIGTAIGLSELGQNSPMVLELGIGPIPCRVNGKTASFTTSVALTIMATPETALVATALGLSSKSIVTQTHRPTQASLGAPFVLVELDSRETLTACAPCINTISKGARQYPAGMDFAIFAYVKNGNNIHSRMFAPLDNIPEDPATGAATAALAALLTEIHGMPQSLAFAQGEDMGRPSTINAETTHNPISVTISGQAVQTMVGEFIL